MINQLSDSSPVDKINLGTRPDRLYTIQCDVNRWNIFCGDVVLDIVYMASRDEDLGSLFW